MLVLPGSQQIERWKKQGNVHPVLLEHAHDRHLIWHVDDALVSGDVRVRVVRVSTSQWNQFDGAVHLPTGLVAHLREQARESTIVDRRQNESRSGGRIRVGKVAAITRYQQRSDACEVEYVFGVVQVIGTDNVSWIVAHSD